MAILKPVHRLALTIAAFAVLAGIYLALDDSEFFRLFAEPRLLAASIRDMQVLGPLLIIGLMCIAIVLNPLPSAPIALAAGAVYGHTLGTVYIVAGAELGAITAFAIARWAGYDFTRRFFGETGALQRIGTQNTLTVLVFVSRLIPFMSFDLVSYAAGLSPLKLWRFALATLLGLIPVSFALAHFGAEIESGNYPVIVGVVLLLGLLTIAPVLLGMFRSRKPSTEPVDSDLRQ
jgi:uncharacterized membrane protein YdjX (TVP38/TMEM64 family)